MEVENEGGTTWEHCFLDSECERPTWQGGEPTTTTVADVRRRQLFMCSADVARTYYDITSSLACFPRCLVKQ